MEKNLGTKSWRNFLEGLKQKTDIFIGTKSVKGCIITFIVRIFLEVVVTTDEITYSNSFV